MAHGSENTEPESLRIDRWLWCLRFFKTRSLAAQAVKRGRIRVNGERAKPSREVKAGNCLSIVRGSQTIDVTVLGMPARRGPAADNTRFFEESPESIGRREQARLRRASDPYKPTEGKPDKRTRRMLRARQR